ncbi:hypothetical protein [Agrobacterium rosae]|uniref:Uncharacterized protein n=1 Tax=Agrobacterium rosae TaxID=1972867 RepID=A0A1R3TIG8_9HYPH|nr:hypothetical protein [Agrobacterium rosae]SCX03742.1 hypothetical protein DSM25559_0345 [Agrobacterium rosae]
MGEVGRLSPMGDESFESFASHQANLVGTRLSITTYPRTGEGLPGLLFRAASDNGYRTAGVFNELLGIQSTARLSHISIADAITDPHRLADILGLRAQHIIPLLYPFTRSQRTHVSFFGREVRRKRFFESWRRVSPVSLQKNPFDKAIWSVAGLTFDPKTRENLLFSCPVCKSPLSYRFTSGVEYCGACLKKGVTTDLRLQAQPIAQVDDEEALKFAISLIDPEVSVEHIDQSVIPDELRSFGSGQLFEFIVSLAQAQDYVTSEKSRQTKALEPFGRRLTPTASELAKAARAILDWPAGFLEYAENLRFHNTEKYRNRLDPELVNLKAPWRDPLAPVVSGLDREMREVILATAKAKRHETLYEAVGRLMTTSDDTVSQSAFNAEIWQLKKRKAGLRHMYAAADLCRKAEASMPASVGIHLLLSSSRSVRDFSTRVGIPVPFIGDLIRDNIAEEFEPMMESVLGREGIPPTETLEARVMRAASRGTPTAQALSLVEACASITKRRINPWSPCLRAITAGLIPVLFVQKAYSPLAEQLYISEFGRLRSLLETLPERLDLLQIPADVQTVRSVLSLSKSSVTLLRRSGTLAADLTMAELWTFRDSFISAAEVHRRLMFNDIHLSHIAINKSLDAAEIGRIWFKHGGGVVILRDRQTVETFYGNQLATMT